MKKKIFYILTLLVIVSLITVISIGATKGPAKPKKIFCLLDTVLESNDGQDNFTWEWRKITGMGMEISKPPHNVYSDKFKIQFGSGDLPDLAEIQTGDYVSTAKSGNLIPLNKFIENSKNLKSIDQRYFDAYKMKDGNIYATPLNSGGGCVTYMRQDWLTKLGLKAPTSYAELYEVLKAFTNNDPDGNGKKDTIGYTLAMKVPASEIDYYNRLIMEDAWFYFVKKGDKWVDGFSEPEFKAALTRFKTLYDEKLIDQEIFTNTTSAARTKVYDGQVGVMEYWTGTWAKTMLDIKSQE
jgi:putative aldouronate transport system substrate-binding protein